MSECKCVAQQASYLTTAENFFGEIFLSDFNWKVSHPDKVDTLLAARRRNVVTLYFYYN